MARTGNGHWTCRTYKLFHIIIVEKTASTSAGIDSSSSATTKTDEKVFPLAWLALQRGHISRYVRCMVSSAMCIDDGWLVAEKSVRWVILADAADAADAAAVG